MEIFKVAGIGIAAAGMAVFVKNWKPEISMQVSLVAAVVIFAAVIPYLGRIIYMLKDIADKAGVEGEYISLILKVIGIAYVVQFASELCSDAGETAIASKIEFAGKVIIMTLSMPAVYSLMGVIENIISFG